MFRDRRLADLERRQRLRDRRFPQGQPREDRTARGIGERRERGVEALRSVHFRTSNII